MVAWMQRYAFQRKKKQTMLLYHTFQAVETCRRVWPGFADLFPKHQNTDKDPVQSV